MNEIEAFQDIDSHLLVQLVLPTEEDDGIEVEDTILLRLIYVVQYGLGRNMTLM